MASPLKGYRWSSFDRELVAFLTALRHDPEAPHPLAADPHRLEIPPDVGELARAIVAAEVEFPIGFLVTLLVEASLNESARMVAGNGNPYAHLVRPFIHFQGGVNDPEAAFQFLRDFFRGRAPAAATIQDMTSQLALDWAARYSQVFGWTFVLRTLRGVSEEGGPANPFSIGFREAFEKLEEDTRTEAD